jgi:histidyl-tRNA synthetase
VVVYPEPKKLGQQLKYASERGFRVALIAGEQELAAGNCQVKDLEQRASFDVPLDNSDGDPLVDAIRGIVLGP